MNGIAFAACCLVCVGWLVTATASGQAQSVSSCQTQPGEERPWLGPLYSPECRAQFVLASFGSLDEKLSVLTAGSYRIMVGRSSRDIVGTSDLRLTAQR